ncbi:hypothetical protein NQ315_004533, partial [Exocentrus adspersus]
MDMAGKEHKDYHWCVVPMCLNTSKSSPHKLFISVPKLQYDMANYMEHRLIGVKKVIMKKNCVPTRCQCQPDRIKRTASTVLRPGFVKKQRLDLVKEMEQTLHQNVTS